MSFRNADMTVEREIASYMDRYLFNRGNGLYQYNRTDEKSQQISGSDGLLTCNKINLSNIVVDEKSAHHYVNTGIENFGMELSFIRKDGTLSPGWFLKEGLSTEYYLFYYVWAKIPWIKFEGVKRPEPDWEKTKADNITGIEYLLVEKKKIQEYLNNLGLNSTRLVKASEYFRDNPNETIKWSKKLNLFFMISRRLDESPVNVFLSRSVFANLSVAQGWVTPLTNIVEFHENNLSK